MISPCQGLGLPGTLPGSTRSGSDGAHIVDDARVVVVERGAQSTRRNRVGAAAFLLPIEMALTLEGLRTPESAGRRISVPRRPSCRSLDSRPWLDEPPEAERSPTWVPAGSRAARSPPSRRIAAAARGRCRRLRPSTTSAAVTFEVFVTDRRVDVVVDGIDIAFRVGERGSAGYVGRTLTRYRHRISWPGGAGRDRARAHHIKSAAGAGAPRRCLRGRR